MTRNTDELHIYDCAQELQDYFLSRRGCLFDYHTNSISEETLRKLQIWGWHYQHVTIYRPELMNQLKISHRGLQGLIHFISDNVFVNSFLCLFLFWLFVGHCWKFAHCRSTNSKLSNPLHSTKIESKDTSFLFSMQNFCMFFSWLMIRFKKSMLSISWIQLVLLSWWETKNLSSFCELTKFPS